MQRGPIIAALAGGAAALALFAWLAPASPDPTIPAEGARPIAARAADPTPATAPGRAAPPTAPEAPAPGPDARSVPGDALPGAAPEATEGSWQRGNVPPSSRRALPATSYVPAGRREAPLAAAQAAGRDDAAGGAGGGGAAGDFDDEGAAVEADWLESTMADFLDTVVPETAGEGLSRSCAADGRSCTFEGPVTDDSFVWRWLEAQAQGQVDLQGVQLSELQFNETEQGRTFTFTATAP